MPLGIFNQTTTSLSDISSIANITRPEQFFINVNHIVFDGWLYFILLATIWVILFFIMQGKTDQMLNNMMYSGAVVTIMSFMLRAIFVVNNGIEQGLLSDKQMWVFPVITIILAGVIWAIKRNQ